MVDAENEPFELEEVSTATPEATLSQARELLLEYGRFVVSQPGGARFCFGSLESEADHLPRSYNEQGGGCLLAKVRHHPVGFVAWRALPPTVAPDAWEMKRLWVRPSGRGLGLGLALARAVLNRAAAAHRKAVYLDTVPTAMSAAHALYLSLGFTPCAPYNDNPIDGIAHLVKYL
jgi:putative acetyltransferase